MNGIRIYLQNLINNPKLAFLYEHIIKPFLGTVFISAFFFLIIYYKNEECSIKDSFFYLYCFLIPLFINLAVSFFYLSPQKKGAAYGLSVVSIPFLAIIAAQIFSRSSFYPAFYREFQTSGSFYILYLIQAVFFVMGGMFLGLIDEFIFSADIQDGIKYPEGNKNSGGSQLSKTKRRKLKKKKRDSQKLAEQNNAVLDEIIKNKDDNEEADESESEADDDEEQSGGTDEPTTGNKEKNDDKK